MIKNSLLVILISLISITISFSQQETRLLRFPTISGEQIVFSYAGDLYSVSSKGGIANKLTNYEGYEMFPKFSPDGKQIAFTGQYDGNTEVYLMPATGGEPQRLTYTATLSRDDISDRMGPNNIIMAWTKDGKNIIYRSRKQSFNAFVGQLFSVSTNGGLSEQLPLPAGGFCSYSPDGKKLAYNRVFREFRTWKYYKGGMADDIWIYDFETKKVDNITNNEHQDIQPMWVGNEIYFLSDRDRIMNLFVYNTSTKEIKKVTNFTDYDIKFPSFDNNRIVFENAGYIYVFDIKTQKAEKLNIVIANDFSNSRNELVDASQYINTSDISPDGARLVIGARGDIFSVPVKDGITRNLTLSSGIHDRNGTWSPDGKYIAYISDATGEFEIYIVAQNGVEKPIQLTKNADTYKYNILWSPDSKKILWSDKMLRLQYINIETKEITIVKKSEKWEISQYSWSPDSKWVTYSDSKDVDLNVIYLYNMDTKVSTPVTDDWYDSDQPVFSNDGKYLLFTSKRDFNPIYSDVEWNYAYKDLTKIYLITLSNSTVSPFAPENNEVDLSKLSDKKIDDKANTSKDKTNKDLNKDNSIKIDLDGIKNRIAVLPVNTGNYYGITAVDDKIYYLYNALGNSTSLKLYNLKDKKEITLGQYYSYSISENYKKMLIRKSGKYYVIDLPSNEIKLENSVDLTNMKVWVNKKEEWKQIYDESWRQMRDFFYDPNMHGVDWKKIHDKYAILVPFVNNRNDLNYLIGEMIGELNVGHAYTGGGDKPAPTRINLGLLGAKLSRHSSGYYKIDKILKGENWSDELRSPLTGIGVNVNEGDYIIAINGKSTKDVTDIYQLLVNTAEIEIELTINTTPDEKGSRKAIIIPVKDEANLYYYEWVENNIKKVNDATKGEVGYIHIPDMGAEGLNEFVKHFYPQLNKKALIIDDRGNGGGNVSPMIIERLKRELSLNGMSRNVPKGSTNPAQMILGPKVLLVNNYSASDGDLFPYQFKHHKMGKVIGLRTWGGVVGIRGSLPFIDGGFLNKPEFAHYAADGSGWIIEGYGVDPDIIVDNDPAKEFAGEDQQLNKAIEVILEDLKTQRKEIPNIPNFPDKSK